MDVQQQVQELVSSLPVILEQTPDSYLAFLYFKIENDFFLCNGYVGMETMPCLDNRQVSTGQASDALLTNFAEDGVAHVFSVCVGADPDLHALQTAVHNNANLYGIESLGLASTPRFGVGEAIDCAVCFDSLEFLRVEQIPAKKIKRPR